MRSDEPKNSYPNITNAKKILSWKPKITLDSGLKKLLNIINKKIMNYRTAIILCGGKGTRLGELGKKLPKTLVKIQGSQFYGIF